MHRRLGVILLTILPVIAGAAEVPLVVDRTRSRIEIPVTVTLHSFVATLTDYQLRLTADPESGRVGTAELDFHFRDIRTGGDARDAAMFAWEDTGRFPDGRFSLDRIEAAGESGERAVGRLSFHGVTREIRFPFTVQIQGGEFTIDGEALVDTRDFDLPVIRKFLFLKVDPRVQVRFHLQGNLGPN